MNNSLRLSVLLLLAACGNPNRIVNGHGDSGEPGGGGDDQGVIVDEDGGIVSGPCDDTHPCSAGLRCFMGACIKDNGTCMSDND